LAVLDLIKSYREQGARIILATASHGLLADVIAKHLDCFHEVLATRQVNLKGKLKRDAIKANLFGAPYIYVGDSWADLPIWRDASHSILIAPSLLLRLRSRSYLGTNQTLMEQRPRLLAILRRWLAAFRIHQWAKNVLILIPLVMAHKISDLKSLSGAAYAFLAFSLCASSVYVVNDLIDLEFDRLHKSKRHRPFAAGELSLLYGALAALLLAATSAVVGVKLGIIFLSVMGLYFITTLAYSLLLKRLVLIDAITLAALYAIRIFAGGVATNAAISKWLIIFSLFFFFSLAMAKRYAEINIIQEELVAGRGYFASDREAVGPLGIVAGLISVLVLVLYISSSDVALLYSRPDWLWFVAPPLLYWIGRIWLLTIRSELHHDPVIFALKDKPSYVVTAIIVGLIWLAI